MERLSLNGKWKLTYFPQKQYSVSSPTQLKEFDLPSVPAVVPGNVELDLSAAGILPKDLYFANNMELLKEYELYEWWYETSFSLPESFSDKKCELFFHGVDCLAEYWLNGQKIGESDNMFIEHRFDIDSVLCRKGENRLSIRLRSPILEALQYEYNPMILTTGIQTIVESTYIRKAPHSYGWDILPRAISAGLWRSVEVLGHEEMEINDLYFSTLQADEYHAKLFAAFDLSLPPEKFGRDIWLEFTGICGESRFFARKEVIFKAGSLKIDVDLPKLWWPKGYGEANLYEVETKLLCGNEVVDQRTDKIGIRTVKLLRTDTTFPEGQFEFHINGEKIICKGSNWVPADVFHSRDAARYEPILEMFEDLNCNILRCWGGNVYEDHAFYESCDRRGIMVWQDFSMACIGYPQEETFLNKMRIEAAAVIKKLRNHPCIILWAGDNENDEFLAFNGIDPAQNKITREILPHTIAQWDPYRPYLPSSPYVPPIIFEKQDRNLMTENHLWEPRDYYKSKFYTQSQASFISEIGYHGCPNLSSIRKFVDADHLWPWQDNDQWVLHSTNFEHNPYRVQLMADQIHELFSDVPDTMEDFILASQSSQAEAKKYFIETIRLQKPQKTGIIWWNCMDGWPQFSDAIVDYYFGKKLAYYFIKRVQQPVCLMITDPEDWHVTVVAGNDSLKDVNGTYRVYDADTDETLLSGTFKTKANQNTVLGRIRACNSDKRLLLIEWEIDGVRYGNHYLFGHPPISYPQFKKWLKKIAALPMGFDAAQIGK